MTRREMLERSPAREATWPRRKSGLNRHPPDEGQTRGQIAAFVGFWQPRKVGAPACGLSNALRGARRILKNANADFIETHLTCGF